MQEKQYQVVLLNGVISSTLYETRQDAVRANRGNILKLVEVIPRKKLELQPKENPNEALFISQRSDEDLSISKNCGYAVMYNCPKRDRIFEGMRYLEVSEDHVLEADLVRLEKYERTVHTAWSHVTPRDPKKPWRYVVYHRNAKMITKEEAQKKYNNTLKGTQGGISYLGLS